MLARSAGSKSAALTSETVGLSGLDDLGAVEDEDEESPVLFGGLGGRERPTVAAHRSGRSARSAGSIDARWWRSMGGCHGAARKKLRASTRGWVRDGSARDLWMRPRPARSVSFLLGTDGPAGLQLMDSACAAAFSWA